MVCAECGGARPTNAKCSIVVKPIVSVKRMTEAGQFVGFCHQGGFALDVVTRKVDMFREDN